MSSVPALTPSLAARLQAVARVLGVEILLGEGTDWRFEYGALQVSPSFFAERGHPEDEAIALTMLELWGPARWATLAPARQRRRRSLANASGALEPLLAAVDRLQASGELLGSFPAFREQLAAATLRSLPTGAGGVDLIGMPRHLQWIAAILCLSLAPGAAIHAEAEVAVELEHLETLGAGGAHPLRRVSAPDPARPALRRFERALALLQPPYERLLATDRAQRGLASAGEDPGADDGPGVDGFDSGAGGEDASGTAEGADAADGDTVAAPPEDDRRARAGERRAESEGADLFAAEQAGFLTQVLATPLPATGAIVDELLELPSELEATSSANDDPAASGAAGRSAAVPADLADYRDRAERLSGTIERMRETWHRVIADRLAERRAFARRASADGELLDENRLVATVTAVRAGIRRPEAFLPRESRRRPDRETGSTDYVLLIDRSGSMRGRPASFAADAALVLLEGLAGVERDLAAAERASGTELDLAIRTSLIVYDAEAVVVKPLAGSLDDRSRRRLRAEVRTPGGATNDAAALRAAGEELGVLDGSVSRERGADGIPRRRIVLLISDGGSNDPAEARSELLRLRARGVEVLGIGIGDDELVRRYTPDGSRVDDPRQLPERVLALVEASIPDA
ncbi:vWA domain-containing protein [Leucobacter iarius]|uniref:VWFA domain-containing protein n=1 Tax=Leucobacter iarius TaxID=333963 RepID=A0ABN2LJK7_9MICO